MMITKEYLEPLIFLQYHLEVAALSLLVFTVAVKFLIVNLWLKPRRMEARFARQGIRGPPYRFFAGNLRELVSMMIEASSRPITPPSSHNILHKVLPFYHHWNKLYGSTFLVWFGPAARLAVSNPELIREIFMRTEEFEKYEAHPVVKQLEGKNGLLNTKGDVWAHHRRILAPTFHFENLKMLVPAIRKSVSDMLDKWPATSTATRSGEFEIDVAEWFETLTEDAVTRAAFGCSYQVGRPIFRLQSEQMVLAADAFHKVFVPGYRFLPTRRNVKSWKLEREVTRLLRRLIESRINSVSSEEFDNGHKDLIGLMIEASKSNSSMQLTVDDMIDECKAFFFAGKQTISKLLTWTSLLLAMHPEWQERAREELRCVCGSSRDLPSKDSILKLKTLSMIINESLRLYPPTVATIRRTKADVNLGGYMIPKGMEILIPVLAVHHDRAIWGDDVNEFNPARFEDGVARAAKHPAAFIPFGLGVRTCIGQNLAVLLAKLAMAVMLQRYSLTLSPGYRHAPKVLLMLYPQHGAPIVFRPLDQRS